MYECQRDSLANPGHDLVADSKDRNADRGFWSGAKKARI